jgi:hypothetical protein
MNRRAFTLSLVGLVASLPSVGYAQSGASSGLGLEAWKKIPSITVMSAKGDTRLAAVREAVRFWNGELLKLGSPFQFGAVTHIVGTVSADDLGPFANEKPIRDEFRQFYNRNTRPIDLRERVRFMSGDVIVALSDGKFKSFAFSPPYRPGLPASRKVLVAIASYPVGMSNVVPNVVAHEFGHAIGLSHNHDPTSLMCDGSAWCWPQFPRKGFLPLTSGDLQRLLEMYPPNWQPEPPAG